MKKKTEKILTFIETYCKKKLVFAYLFLHFKTFGKAHAHCAHWQSPQVSACKRVQFLRSLYTTLREFVLLMFLLILSLSIKASEYYTTTSDLNIRSGAGTNFKSQIILEKGDTVKLLKNVNDYWVKVQYHDEIGYVVMSYLQPIELKSIEIEPSNEEEDPFVPFFIFLAFVIIFAIILKQRGKKNRNKSTATLLSLFFGVLGFQKFYLGETGKGIVSILFFWTLIPLLFGLIDFIKFALMNDVKFNDRYNWGKKLHDNTKSIEIKPKFSQNNYQRNESTYQMPQNKQIQDASDMSIIDISNEKLDLTVVQMSFQKGPQIEPPYWGHTYVYSFDEIRNATQPQKKYYYYLKNKVLTGEIVEIQGNTNYAFILYFDFLKEYQSHRDIKLLEEQFKLIGQICPKTKIYTLRLLQDELRKRNDSYSIDKLKALEERTNQVENGYIVYNPDLNKLGNQYKDKLGLDKQAIKWLNKFNNPSNAFLSIEGCIIATIMQYITLLKELDIRLKKTGTTLVKEVTYFKDKLKSIYANHNSSWDYYAASYLDTKAESEVYLVLFKRVENSVRDSFGHKRKLTGNFIHENKNLAVEFEERIGILFNELIEESKSNIGKPDLETQIALNIQNTARWKIELDKLKTSFKPELICNFIEGIIHLEKTNQKNPNIENIFFEVSNFIATYDKVQSLNYYIKYIYYNLKSNSLDNKELTKTVQKSLFNTQEQLDNFNEIIAELIKTSDIQTALEKITKIYVPKRKKIQLDKSEIEVVKQKHEGTVELLNEYLNSDNEETVLKINTLTDEDAFEIISSAENDSIFISEISIGKVQEELLKKIVSNSFRIHQVEVNKFANENQMFKNQIIDSINESFADYLDGEALIEEDGDNYIMEESYYNVITKK